jgi:spermidine/putrescine transport system substrate-binding protein
MVAHRRVAGCARGTGVYRIRTFRATLRYQILVSPDTARRLTMSDAPNPTLPILGTRLDRRGFLRISAASAAALMAAGLLTTRTLAQGSFNGVTLDFIGLDGEDGQVELEQWRQEQGVTLAKTPFSSWDETFAKLKTDVFDVALVANPYVSQWGKAGVLTPLDLSRLSNWNDVFPALKDADFLRDEAGNVYAVPIAWGDGPYVYAPDRVATPPKSITELLDPAWKGRITTFDDPILPFHMLAVAKGYPSPNLTKEQLADVKEDAKKLVANLRTFTGGYQDATDLLVRGEVDLAIGGWEAMVNWAKEKDATLDFGFFDEVHGGGWADSLAIPTNAQDVDAAYAYIDQMIAPEVNAQVATNLISGTVNAKSKDLVDPSAMIYDYSIVEDPSSPIRFEAWTPPLEAEGDIATKQDWDDAWQEIRAG